MNQTQRQAPSLFVGVLTTLWMGTAAALALLLIMNLGVSLLFSGRIFPGVKMNNIPLSGLNLNQASATIAENYDYPEKGSLVLTDSNRSWVVQPIQMGLYLDPDASARAAFDAGRKGSILQILRDRLNLIKGGVDTHPTFVYSQRTAVGYLISLASQIDQPIREASLSLNGTEVVVNNGQPGRVLDIPATLEAVTAQVQSMRDGVVPLVIRESAPAILDATLQAELARGILNQPFQLVVPAELGAVAGPWQLDPPALAQMLAFSKVSNGGGAEYQVSISEPLIRAFFDTIRKETDHDPVNSRFTFDDDTHQLILLTPAVIGRILNIEVSINSINEALKKGEHSASLAFNITNPAVTDKMTGAEMGITELVQAYTSYFRGSSQDRVQNIKIASERFHGLLIAPGETLSMSDVLGDITLDNGYAEALIILGDETIKGVGGGVCQVSTTLFRTAFYAGFPIVERHPHAYRVGYYEQTSSGGHDANLAGLDATVFVPLVDFKFTNDTPHWLLMETYISTSNYSLTWKFYSTGDGREVTYHTSGVKNVVKAPDPLYRENPELPKGTIKQVDYAADGADVIYTRTVTRGGTILYDDRFNTHYQPWRAIYEYGPGTENFPKSKP